LVVSEPHKKWCREASLKIRIAMTGSKTRSMTHAMTRAMPAEIKLAIELAIQAGIQVTIAPGAGCSSALICCCRLLRCFGLETS
jgi:hypothetical protein